LKIGRETMQPIYDFIADATKENKPFFVWYAPMMPHLPHNPPARFLDKYRNKTNSIHVAKYWATVEWFDETCGQLIEHLDQRGLTSNTIIVYVADNGWIQSVDNPECAPKSKQSQYDGGLRTPIMVRWPGKVQAQKSAGLASSIDLAPTLLRAAGADVPRNMPGIDLLDTSAVKKRDAVFGTCFTHDAVDLQAPAKSVRWRWCVQDEWKFIVPSAANEPNAPMELYNLADDPHEERNLADKEKKRVARLQKKVDSWWNAK
jgi:arylsulfatase A-like enzyme